MVDHVLFVGTVFGPFILAGWLLVAALCWRRVAGWLLVVQVVLVVIAALTITRYWHWWGVAFDYADADLPVPAEVDHAETIMATLTAISIVVLVGLAIAGLWSSRSRRTVPRGQPIGL